jgi:hypothetical protein
VVELYPASSYKMYYLRFVISTSIHRFDANQSHTKA